ncbi:hypothetical protein ABIB30_000530 [Pedobacter sp. UYP1]
MLTLNSKVALRQRFASNYKYPGINITAAHFNILLNEKIIGSMFSMSE